MRLKRLDIKGFKSFCDPEGIEFEPGITMIVGPNGCGKSNIFDAFRWVMGEMSAKALRGSAMENVIFNGADGKKPVGRAEVVMTLINDGTRVLPGNFERFAEIQVTRRLYRDGSSEYLINNAPCRLKDIVDLFMAGGIGMRTYSIVEQGKIGEIIQAKPDQRRTLIEDAAGITKYKRQKQTAERKLDNVEGTILRINDVLGEMERQRRSLKRQAAEARRYKNLSSEIRRLDLYFNLERYKSLSFERDKTNFNYIMINEDVVGLAARIDAAEARESTLNLEKLNAEKKLEKLLEQVAYAREKLNEQKQRATTRQFDLERISEARQRYQGEIAEAKQKIELSSKEEEQLAAELAKLGEEKGRIVGELTDRQQRFESMSARREELARQVEDARSDAIERSKDIASYSSKIAQSDEKTESALRQQERIDSEQAELSLRQAEAETKRVELLEAKQENELDGEKLGDDLTAASQSHQSLRERIDALQVDLEQQRGLYSRRQSRLEALEALDRAYEGLGEGVRAIMEKSTEEGDEDVIGLLADRVRAETKYEAAIEAALGEMLESVIVRQPETGLRAVEFLLSRGAGRGSFIPSDIDSNEPAPDISALGDRALGRLMDLVEIEPLYRPIFEHLLGDVVVVEDIDRALSLFRSHDISAKFVTLDGQLVDQAGVISGGAPEPREASVIARKREMREIGIEITALDEKIAAIESKRRNLDQEITAVTERISELEKRIGENRYARVEVMKNIEMVEKDKEELGRRIKGLQNQSEDLSRELWDIKEARKEAELALEKATAQKEKAESDFGIRSEELSRVGFEIERLSEELTGRKVEAESIKVRYDHLKAEVNRRRSDRDHLSGVLDDRHRRLHDDADRREEIESEVVDIEKVIGDMIITIEQTEAAISVKRTEYDEYGVAVRAMEERIKILRTRYKRISAKANALLIRLSELRPKIENIEERVRENYIVEISEYYPAPEDIPEMTTDKIEKEVADLKRKRDTIGSVNLSAIEEYEVLEERYGNLSSQKEDLESSILRLRRVIDKINSTIRERFEHTFHAINDKFKEVFPILFQGGTAELRLVGSSDLLECGVDILAQPPGKSVPNMSLLSGGEQALAAVSLIFAIMLYRPSPFCLLDEIDAPIDEANITRLQKLLQRMSKVSQIIMISHNKRTMEIANDLYGVTMQQKGVSKVITMKINQN